MLSVRQPFANLIAQGIKGIENRSKPLSYRGPLLIHASKKWSDTPVDEIERRYGVTIPRNLPLGGIIGIVHMPECVSRSDDKFFTGPYGYLLRGATELPLIRCVGSIGLVRPTAGMMRQLRALSRWEQALKRALKTAESRSE